MTHENIQSAVLTALRQKIEAGEVKVSFRVNPEVATRGIVAMQCGNVSQEVHYDFGGGRDEELDSVMRHVKHNAGIEPMPVLAVAPVAESKVEG